MKAKILTVDDSPSVLWTIRTALERDGHLITEAANGREALATLASASAAPADLIITDLYMPGLDGLSLVRLIRRLEGYRCTPILVLTAECSDVMKRRGRAAGATRWLLKPFHAEELCRAVNRALGATAACPRWSREPQTLGRPLEAPVGGRNKGGNE